MNLPWGLQQTTYSIASNGRVKHINTVKTSYSNSSEMPTIKTKALHVLLYPYFVLKLAEIPFFDRVVNSACETQIYFYNCQITY